MKIAGRKNPGAWYRTNKLLKALTSDEKVQLTNIIEELDTIDAIIAAIATLAGATGVTVPPTLTDESTFAATLVSGIPLQIWMGKPTFTTYTKDTTGEDDKYIPDLGKAFQDFGVDLRQAIKQFEFARRELYDLENIKGPKAGNPSGRADATKGN